MRSAPAPKGDRRDSPTWTQAVPLLEVGERAAQVWPRKAPSPARPAAPTFLLLQAYTHRKMSETANLASSPCHAHSSSSLKPLGLRALTGPERCTKQRKSSERLKVKWCTSSCARTWSVWEIPLPLNKKKKKRKL